MKLKIREDIIGSAGVYTDEVLELEQALLPVTTTAPQTASQEAHYKGGCRGKEGCKARRYGVPCHMWMRADIIAKRLHKGWTVERMEAYCQKMGWEVPVSLVMKAARARGYA